MLQGGGGVGGRVCGMEAVWAGLVRAHLPNPLGTTASHLRPPTPPPTCLARVSLCKVWGQADAGIRILDAVRPGTQLGVARRAVTEQLVRVGVHARRPAGQGLGVVLDGLGVAALLERGVARLPLGGGLAEVDVRCSRRVLQRLLGGRQLVQRVRRPVLRQGLERRGGWVGWSWVSAQWARGPRRVGTGERWPGPTTDPPHSKTLFPIEPRAFW